MKLRDIPPFITCNYRVNVSWTYLEDWLLQLPNLNLEPDFQRAHGWDKEKQIKYLEFILKRGTSSRDLYFNNPGWDCSLDAETVIVDGKQRLEAVRAFMRNEVPIFGGNYKKDFEDEPNIIHASFVVHINSLKTKKEILQWYLDLNTGGVVHTDEEIDKVKALLGKENGAR